MDVFAISHVRCNVTLLISQTRSLPYFTGTRTCSPSGWMYTSCRSPSLLVGLHPKGQAARRHRGVVILFATFKKTTVAIVRFQSLIGS
jgi:hypothetical protein